jgi:uncharacterized DUF497 family protein
MNLDVIIQFELKGLLFQYEEEKGRKNFKKHGVLFEDAAWTFFDEWRETNFNRSNGDEDRWETMGHAKEEILFVVYTERKNSDGKEVTHLISARKTSKRERKRMDSVS